MTRVFLCAGESSGDIHGANLIRALRRLAPTVECEGLGGRHMAEAGMALEFDLAGRAIMGFTEVVRSLGLIRRLFREAVDHMRAAPPDVLVLVDYPGFNIRLAREAKRMGIPVVYYISPQVWAWKKGRIHTLARLVDRMLVILPFEEKLYRDIGAPCTYVGHPLLDHVGALPDTGAYTGELVIGLLPGSREQEIRRLLAPMLDVAAGIAKAHPEARFVTPCVDAAREAQIRAVAGDFPLDILVGRTYELLRAARFCLVASGTATLETALFGVPMLILYRVSELSYRIARRLVHLEHIGLVNILAGKGIVPEFIQHDIRTDRMLPSALNLIGDTPERARMLRDLAEVRARLGGGGASERAAAEVLDVVRRRHA